MARRNYSLLANTKNRRNTKRKYPGGAETQKLVLEQEGKIVIRKGKNYLVKDYLKAVIPLNQ
jgi:hypothetical protein